MRKYHEFPKQKIWDKLSGKTQDRITDKYFKERDVFPYDDLGRLTPTMKRILKAEGYKLSK